MSEKGTEVKMERALTNQEIISLVEIYLTEFNNRLEMLWTQAYKLFYAALVIILFPNIQGYLGVSLGPVPLILFRVLGLLTALLFGYISWGYALRMDDSKRTYYQALEKLADLNSDSQEFRRVTASRKKHGKPFSVQPSYSLTLVLFGALVILNAILIVWG